jgi:hypothetical protein
MPPNIARESEVPVRDSYLGARAALLAIVCLAAAACVTEPVGEAVQSACAGAACAAAPACDGDAPDTFCDDCNPCTADANCTPCSTLPPEQRDMYHCTADERLPRFCAGKTGCVHVPLTTPADRINDCFPVAGDPDLHAGACLSGTCVENDR